MPSSDVATFASNGYRSARARKTLLQFSLGLTVICLDLIINLTILSLPTHNAKEPEAGASPPQNMLSQVDRLDFRGNQAVERLRQSKLPDTPSERFGTKARSFQEHETLFTKSKAALILPRFKILGIAIITLSPTSL